MAKAAQITTQQTTPSQSSPDERVENVFLFVPNIIGYTRILLAGISLYYMPKHPIVCVTLYGISCLLDAVDGNAARALDQCSKFGAVLDMVTDRCTTTCLLCYLFSVYPAYAILFQFLISLDISSHYMQMYSALIQGAESHKQIKKDSNPFLRAYYTNNKVLFIMCAGNELFFVALYLLASANPLPIFDVDFRLVLAVVTFPICAAKQVISVIQFVNASKSLARIDIEDRMAKRALKNK